MAEFHLPFPNTAEIADTEETVVADEEKQEIVREDDARDDEAEETQQPIQFVFTGQAALSTPGPFILHNSKFREVPIEKREPKPFYPLPPAMSFGNIRHTVNDKITTVEKDGDKMILTKREITAIDPSALYNYPTVDNSEVVEEVHINVPPGLRKLDPSDVPDSSGMFCGTPHLKGQGKLYQ